MNGIILLGLFLALAIFGYLTVGRWLQRSTFALPPRPPTDEERRPVSPLLALAAHAGTVPGLLTLVSILIAMYWGWTPAFVWVLLGSTVGGLVYFLGNRYWSNFISPDAPLAQYEETGARAVACGHGFILVTLLASVAMLITLSALLMSGHPGLLFALAMAYPAYLCFRNSALATGSYSLPGLAWGLLSVACLVTGIVLGHNLAVLIQANWQPAPGLFPGLVITDQLVWAVLILIGVIAAGGRQQDDDTTETGVLSIFSGLLFLLLVILLILSLLFGNPDIVAPAHTSDDSTPSFLWLFMIMFVGGILSASRGIVSLERKYLEGSAPRHALHFSGYMLDSLLAVLVLIAMATLGGADGGATGFEKWPGQPDIGQLLLRGSTALAATMGSIGIPAQWAETITLFVLQLTALSFMAHLLPLCRRMLDQSGIAAIPGETVRSSIPTAAVAILTLLFLLGGPGYGGWLLLGMLNALTVGILMLYVNWTLVRNQKQFMPAFIISLLVVVAAISQGIAATSGWVSGGQWVTAIVALLILLVAAVPLISLLRLTLPALGQKRSGLDLFDRE